MPFHSRLANWRFGELVNHQLIRQIANSGIHELHGPTLWGPASVVWDRRDVTNGLHLQPDSLQRPDRGLAARAWPFDPHVERPHPDRFRGITGVQRRLGRSKRRPL